MPSLPQLVFVQFTYNAFFVAVFSVAVRLDLGQFWDSLVRTGCQGWAKYNLRSGRILASLSYSLMLVAR